MLSWHPAPPRSPWGWDSQGTATPTQWGCLAGVDMLPHTHLTPAHVHSSLCLVHHRRLQGRLIGTSGHPHLQLWPPAWLRAASLPYRKPLPSRRMRIWQNLCQLFSYRPDAVRQMHRPVEQKALAAPPGHTSPMQQSYGRTTLPRATFLKCEGQEHRCLCPCPLLPATCSHRQTKGHPCRRMAAMCRDVPGNKWLLIAAAHFSVCGFSTVKSLRLNASLRPGTRDPGAQVSGRKQWGFSTAKEKAFHLFPRS